MERETKDTLFVKEQQDILCKLFEITGLKANDKNSYINKPDIESKTHELVKLYDDIRKFHKSDVWMSIKRADDKSLPIIRNILKFHGYALTYKTVTIKVDNKPTRVKRYFAVGGF